jgi:transcriptional regulator with XRE-family HTH domain
MSLRLEIISKLLNQRASRESYLRAKLNQLISSQIKALRLREGWTQKDLGDKADMKQARISAMEKPGLVTFTLETLIRLAAAFRVGLKVEFVPISEMVRWDNSYSQDEFSVVPIEKDEEFLNPTPAMQKYFFSSIFYTPPTTVPSPIVQGVKINSDRSMAA